jgi:acetyl-CoA decarbonylase/synthase complex subunit gamma
MQIYKNLPKTNCKDCGLPTCMAFAMQVAAKQRAITDCPHITEEATASVSEASAPPMQLVKIGGDGKGIELGQETVMFRHEERFHRPAGIAIRIPSSLSDGQAEGLVERVNASSFERVGATLRIAFAAVEVDGCDDPADRAKRIAAKSDVPLILVGKTGENMRAAAGAIAAQRPLIYRADSSNLDEFAAIASEMKLPLAVEGADLEELEKLATAARDRGIKEIVLGFVAEHIGHTGSALTIARRSALRKRFLPFGYPAMVEIVADSPESEAIFAGIFSAKYASIVLINGLEPWEVIPVMVTVQDVYTDPQVPNTVEAKLYEIGNPDENSPVLFTTNFSLTYFSVEGEVERSKIPAFISVVDTEGLGVLNSYAGDKISAEKVVKTLKEQNVSERVNHRKLIIPGLLPIFRAEIEDTSEWKEVIIGPETSKEIPAFLNNLWK